MITETTTASAIIILTAIPIITEILRQATGLQTLLIQDERVMSVTIPGQGMYQEVKAQITPGQTITGSKGPEPTG
jgi:hypothetical protein